jgi:hypothetical protein
MSYYNTVKKVKPYEVADYSATQKNVGVLLLTQKMLDEYYNNSSELATNSEVQVHYRALNFTAFLADNSSITFTIPTAVYNYTQKVSSAAIDFDLRDVIEMTNSKEVIEVHESKKQELLATDFFHTVAALLGIEFNDFIVSETDFNNIHLHPSGISSFSGTDLATESNNPGICFPLSDTQGYTLPIWSSIIFRKPTRLVHTEFRTAEGSVAKKDMTYWKERSLTIVKGDSQQPNSIEAIFEVAPKVRPTYTVLDDLHKSDMVDTLTILVEEFDYEPDTTNVKSERVTKQVAHYWGYDHGTYKVNNSTKTQTKSEVIIALQKKWKTADKKNNILKYYDLNRIPLNKLKDLLKYTTYKAVKEFVEAYEPTVVVKPIEKHNQEVLDTVQEITLYLGSVLQQEGVSEAQLLTLPFPILEIALTRFNPDVITDYIKDKELKTDNTTIANKVKSTFKQQLLVHGIDEEELFNVPICILKLAIEDGSLDEIHNYLTL